jgi:hypothetical protein
MRWSAWVVFIAGLGLIAAPFATGYSALSTTATTEAVVVGLLIAAFALWTAFRSAPVYVEYILAACGAWSIVAPFVLGYSGVELARNSDILVGAVVALIAIVRAIYRTPVMHDTTATA